MGKILMDLNSKYNLENNLISNKSKLMYEDIYNLAISTSDNIIFTMELNNIYDHKDVSTCIIVDYNKNKQIITILGNKNELDY